MTRLLALSLAVCAALLALAGIAQAAYTFQTAWGSQGAGPGQFSGPAFAAVGPDGAVYVADTGNNRVEKFNNVGAFVTDIGTGQLNQPLGVGVGPDGTLYVADSGNNRIVHFAASGSVLTSWGTPGSLDGQFNHPTGLAVGPDGSVYVADNVNKRMERFAADGTFLSSFTSPAGTFNNLQGVAADATDGTVDVVDAEPDNRVDRFDASGAFQTSFGSSGSGNGQFSAPRGVATNGAAVYVADSGQNRVEKFTTSGAFVDDLTAGSSGDAQFASPFGVAASTFGDVYVTFASANRAGRYTDTATTGPRGSLPPPQTGVSANAAPVSGTVKVKKPGSATFELLTAGEQIPIGSIVDVTAGTVALTTTKSAKVTQTAQFYEGVFKLLQDKGKAPVTTLSLFGGNFAKACGSARGAAHAAANKSVRHLWGRGKGRFRTRGRYASATIRGTQWLTDDRCNGTLVRVKQGAVSVRDVVRKVSVLVKAPKSYFAARKGLRKR